MSASLAAQKAIRSRLIATSDVTALVPVAGILDRNSLPAPDPSIVIGEGEEADEGRVARNVVRVFSTVHIWKKEPSTAGVKAIAGAIRGAVKAGRPAGVDGYAFGDFLVSGIRFLRDPDGQTSHGMVTIETLVTEPA